MMNSGPISHTTEQFPVQWLTVRSVATDRGRTYEVVSGGVLREDADPAKAELERRAANEHELLQAIHEQRRPWWTLPGLTARAGLLFLSGLGASSGCFALARGSLAEAVWALLAAWLAYLAIKATP